MLNHVVRLVVATTILATGAFVDSMPLHAQSTIATTANAAESDPVVMGWMQGFPPPPDKRIGQPDSNYFSFPKLRWTVCHLRELLPTTEVSRGLGAPVPLERAIDEGIDDVTFRPLGSDETMQWKESLAANYTDGILILHKSRIVYERFLAAWTKPASTPRCR